MTPVNVTVNGQQHELPDQATVSDLLDAVNVDSSRTGIAVAVNDTVIRRPEWDAHRLGDADRVDIIQATQGG